MVTRRSLAMLAVAVVLVRAPVALAGPSSSGNTSTGSVLQQQVQRGDPPLTAPSITLMLIGLLLLVGLALMLGRVGRDGTKKDTEGS